METRKLQRQNKQEKKTMGHSKDNPRVLQMDVTLRLKEIGTVLLGQLIFYQWRQGNPTL
jgi:hypothetical protein